MEAGGLKTLDNLLASEEERVELIDGRIVERPVAKAEHSLVQSHLAMEIGSFGRREHQEGWWLATAVNVSYEPHQCPTHDLAGWRKTRFSKAPDGVIDLPPDWVCEIVSPGHERKDTLTLFQLLQRHRVPHYWLIWPEDRVLIAYQLDGDGYRVVSTITDQKTARIPPFEDVELDLAYLLGE